MEDCRRNRLRAEPEERGRGISRKEEVMPMDVKEAIEQYEADKGQMRIDTPQHPVRKKRKIIRKDPEDCAYRANRQTTRSEPIESPEAGRCVPAPLNDMCSSTLSQFTSDPSITFQLSLPDDAETSSGRTDRNNSSSPQTGFLRDSQQAIPERDDTSSPQVRSVEASQQMILSDMIAVQG